MKLLIERWRQYIKEGETEYFPWLKGIRESDDLGKQRTIAESDLFKKLGSGSFRTVYQPVSDPDYVIKLIHGNSDYEMQMNKDDFDTALKYPFIFPKAYTHADDYSWVVMENTSPLTKSEEMQQVLDQSFPSEQKALLGSHTFLAANPGLNTADAFGIMKMIMDSFRSDREELPLSGDTSDSLADEIQKIIVPVSGPAYQELSKVMHDFPIDKEEIGRYNIGRDKKNNFKIIDSSVFDPDFDYNPEEEA